MLHVWKTAMDAFGLTFVSQEARPPPQPLPRRIAQPPETYACSDAGYEEGRVTLGVATSAGTAISVRLTGQITSSFEAEMAGITYASSILPANTRALDTDNEGCVRHINRLREAPLSMQFRMLLNNVAPDLTLTALARLGNIPLRWVKGHVEHNRSPEEELNYKADLQTRKVTPNHNIERSELTTKLPGMIMMNGRVVGPLKTLVDTSTPLLGKWALCADLTHINKSTIAFYFKPQTEKITLAASTLASLMAVRMRSLFSTERPNKCICGADIDSAALHVTLECTHPSHTITPSSFRANIVKSLGVGWWSPPCLPEGRCGCDRSGYTCTHRTHIFAPHGSNDTRPLSRWAEYLHQRLGICHPTNQRL